MVAAWTTQEALAVARLRQWAADKTAGKYGKIAKYRRSGWQQRTTATFDARLVRSLDFERALDSLEPRERVVLVLSYRDKLQAPNVAQALGCSTRTIGNLLPAARLKLAAVLDKLDLL